MDFKNMILYNDLGYKVYDGKIYNNGYIKEENKNVKKDSINNIKRTKINVLLVSCGLPGKTCLINRLVTNEFNEITLQTIGIDFQMLNYKYNKNEYKIKLFDSAGAERYQSISLNYVKTSEIIIYLFDLSKDDEIKESFINSIKENNNNKKLIYLIGNKLDLEEAKENIEKYRLQAKKLIDRGRINKYFELSARSGEGIDFFLKHLKIDSSIMIDNNKSDPLNDQIDDNKKTNKKTKTKNCMIF